MAVSGGQPDPDEDRLSAVVLDVPECWEDEIKEPQPSDDGTSERLLVLRDSLLEDVVSNKIFHIPLAYTYTVAPTGGAPAIVNTYCNNDPSPSPDWTGCAGLFREYRVTEVQVEFTPLINPVASAVSWTMPAMTYIDEITSTTAPTVTTQCTGHADTLMVESPYKSFIRKWRPLINASNPDDTWNSTASPAASGAIKFLCGLNGTSVTFPYAYGVTIRWQVEFRGVGGP